MIVVGTAVATVSPALIGVITGNLQSLLGNVSMKTCKRCGVEKQLTEFYLCKTTKDFRRGDRKSKIRENGGELSLDISMKLFKLQRGKCACCHRPLGNNYHLDHRVPVALGGSNTDDNMQLLRALCNLQKGAKDPVEFMQSRGFLL